MIDMRKKHSLLNIIFGLSGVIVGILLITNIIHNSSKISTTSKNIASSLNPRQKKIKQILSKYGMVTIKELVIYFPKISTRTLRRDMDILVNRGYVSQEGSTKSTYYRYLFK